MPAPGIQLNFDLAVIASCRIPLRESGKRAPKEVSVDPVCSIRATVEAPRLADLECLSDDQLMGALHAGVEDALAVLFDRYYRLVLSIARKIVRDPGEAEDVMQTVFLEIFRAAGQFDPGKGTTKVWILQYAYHRAINRKQHLNARNFYSQVDVDESQPVSPWGDSGYTHDELKRLLEEGLAMLNASQRQVIELASYYGLSMKEISDHTSDSVANVRHHYYRGLQKLRAFIVGPTGKVVNARRVTIAAN